MIRAICLGALAVACLFVASLFFSVPGWSAGLHPRCNVDWPCAGDFFAKSAKKSVRAQRLYQAMPFGTPIVPPETQRSFLAGGDLVSKARHYMGSNPTGWRSLWCARFMAMIAPEAAAKVRNPNMARDWASLPRVSPQIGAIAVLARGKRGGHIGVVSGFDAGGNPIIVSGNHNRRVGEAVYSANRVLAYVSGS